MYIVILFIILLQLFCVCVSVSCPGVAVTPSSTATGIIKEVSQFPLIVGVAVGGGFVASIAIVVIVLVLISFKYKKHAADLNNASTYSEVDMKSAPPPIHSYFYTRDTTSGYTEIELHVCKTAMEMHETDNHSSFSPPKQGNAAKNPVLAKLSKNSTAMPCPSWAIQCTPRPTALDMQCQ